MTPIPQPLFCKKLIVELSHRDDLGLASLGLITGRSYSPMPVITAWAL
jgi:hypothetical protein